MTKEEIKQKLDDIVYRNFGESYHEHECSFEDCNKMVKEAYNLGIETASDRIIEYFQESDGEAHGDNYQEEVLKLKL